MEILPIFLLGFNNRGNDDPIIWQRKMRTKFLDLINYNRLPKEINIEIVDTVSHEIDGLLKRRFMIKQWNGVS